MSISSTAKSRFFSLLFLLALYFFPTISVCQAEPEELKKGVARGTFMLQGYSYVGSPGTLRFYAAGAQAAESSLSYVDDAYISPDEGDYQGNPFELKGTFSGGPNGVATFTTPSGTTFNVPLKNGRTFELSIPGVQVNMTVTDPTIFDIAEEDMPEEYDPNAPLTDSGARAAQIDGQVEIACPPDFEAWDILKRHTVIYNHCRLKTGEDSTLQISLLSGTSFTMKPETELIVNEARKEKTSFQLLFGGVWANVKKMAKGEEFGFKGSQAVAGIKGTRFMFTDTGTESKLEVTEGMVAFRSNVNGTEVMVAAGEAVTATASGLSEKTSFDATALDNELIKETTVEALAPIIADVPTPATNKETDKKKNDMLLSGTMIAILAAVVGGTWVVSKKKSK